MERVKKEREGDGYKQMNKGERRERTVENDERNDCMEGTGIKNGIESDRYIKKVQ